MRTFTIEPRDPLIARDGRPSALGRYESLPFPLPSTLAGAARTRMASAKGAFYLPPEKAKRLLELPVHGPLLLRLGDEGEEDLLFAAAPRDAVILQDEGGEGLRRLRLEPRPWPKGSATSAPPELLGLTFAAGSWSRQVKGKPPADLPELWSFEALLRWLGEPEDDEIFSSGRHTSGALPREARTHLAIKPGQRVGDEGAIFVTEGLRFLTPKGEGSALAVDRMALSVRVGEDPQGRLLGESLALREELAPLGGERRLARWRQQRQPWPELPAAIREKVAATGKARLVLLTPALFGAGALPLWSGRPFPGHENVKVRVRAAAVPRAGVVSGWDLAAGKPKSTRRLAAAGSVYFVDIEGSREDREAFCERVWLQPISDAEQDRRDGFGLVALGIWPETASPGEDHA